MDPSTMTDEELNKVIETGVAPEEPESPEEPETPEPPESSEEPETPVETPSEESTEEPAPPSRREQLRIQQLLAKYGDPSDRAPAQPPLQRASQLDYGTALDADPEVIKQLEADRQAGNQAQYNEGLKRAEYLNWHTSLKIDAPKVESKYPILDKDSPEFHPAVADALNSWYLKMSGFNSATQTVANTDISYSDFVEANMELVEEIAGQRNAQSVKNIAQQTATMGLRPDGSSAKRLNLNQAPESMSIEELYAKIGQTPPKKQ